MVQTSIRWARQWSIRTGTTLLCRFREQKGAIREFFDIDSPLIAGHSHPGERGTPEGLVQRTQNYLINIDWLGTRADTSCSM